MDKIKTRIIGKITPEIISALNINYIPDDTEILFGEAEETDE